MTTQQQGSDLQGAARPCDGRGAQIKCTRRSDAQASVWRSAANRENQFENRVARTDTGEVNRTGDKIEHETKASGGRGCVLNEFEREIALYPAGAGSSWEMFQRHTQVLRIRERALDQPNWRVLNESVR
jgi:hypothetical protein